MPNTAIVENIIASIRKRINEYEQLAADLTRDYRLAGEPIPYAIRQQYENIGSLVEGLQEAIYIVMREGVG